MITSEIIRLLSRRCPNYHILASKFIKGHLSVCPCAACRNCIRRHGTTGMSFATYFCGRVLDDMIAMKCAGHAVVAGNGTCDAAEFIQERYDDFSLEGDRIAPDARIHAQKREMGSGQVNISPAEKTQDNALQADSMRCETQTIPMEDHYVEES